MTKTNTPRSFGMLENFAALALLTIYAWLFWQSLTPYWFNPEWTSDDASQQVYQFWEAIFPGRFSGDIVTESMMSYFAPLHYWICYSITRLCGDPIMMGHWVMLVQIGLTAFFLFLAVRVAAGFAPGCLAALWFLHTRHIIQRLTGGFSRGWVAPLCAAYFYLVFSNRYRGCLLLLLIACLLNPLAAFMLIFSHGLFLFVQAIWSGGEKRRAFVVFLLCCPIYFGVTYATVKRPTHLGKMVSYEKALQMPELQKKTGRFEIVPFAPPGQELSFYSMQVFVATFHKGSKWLKRNIQYIVCGLLALMLVLALLRRTTPFPMPLITFVLAVLATYFLARLYAFHLYIPVRYIRIPLGLSLILAFTIGIKRLFFADESRKQRAPSLSKRLVAVGAYGAIAVLVFLGSGSGLQKKGNFNYRVLRDGHVFAWLREHTAPNAIIAGHPIFMNPTQLVAIRKAYMTNETAHPFYDKYYEVVKKRLTVSLRAHYARSLRELKSAIGNEQIDYFVFERKRFYPDALKSATYFAPFDKLVKKLNSNRPDQYAYRELMREKKSRLQFVVYQDSRAVVIDVAKLKKSKFVSAG